MNCERAPVVWLRRRPPPPPAGDDGGGLAGLGFGGARRRRLRHPRVAQAERREGPSTSGPARKLVIYSDLLPLFLRCA
jgi:hypothetical protein